MAETKTKKMPQEPSLWWKEAVFYQIYPRSFCDSNGDGIGDIPGIISKLNYLQDLGIDAIWLSPVYKSPNRDYGYDIEDYYDINPEYGTLEDMKKLFHEAKKRNIRIIMDLIINHTSDQHPWFQMSRNPRSRYRDFYIWRDGKKDFLGHVEPPNNWTSFFTGPAWTRDPKSGQYYLHIFTKQQTDLNYQNPKVINEIKKVMNYWLDMGAAGFRYDAIDNIYKESFAGGRWRWSARGMERYSLKHGFYEILRELHHDVLAPRKAFSVGETNRVMFDLDAANHLTAGDALDLVFAFDHMLRRTQFTPERMKQALIKWQRGLPWNALFFENHDSARVVSKYGSDGAFRVESAKMFATLLLTLEGTPFIYQGQEIGMTNMPFSSIKQTKDIVGHNVYQMLLRYRIPKKLAVRIAVNFSRDHVRTPMQWDDMPNARLLSGRSWLPINPNYKQINVARDAAEPNSIGNYYRSLIALRRRERALRLGDIRLISTKQTDVLIYERRSGKDIFLVIVNMGGKTRDTRLEAKNTTTLLSNYSRRYYHGDIKLMPYEAAVLRLN